RDLEVDEPARRRVLPRVQGVPRDAAPVRDVETGAIVEAPDLGSHLPFGAHFGLQDRVAEVGRTESWSRFGIERAERGELVEGARLQTRLPERCPQPQGRQLG